MVGSVHRIQPSHPPTLQPSVGRTSQLKHRTTTKQDRKRERTIQLSTRESHDRLHFSDRQVNVKDGDVVPSRREGLYQIRSVASFYRNLGKEKNRGGLSCGYIGGGWGLGSGEAHECRRKLVVHPWLLDRVRDVHPPVEVENNLGNGAEDSGTP